ncbi:hypothetical protein [Vibrio sp. WXL103]|uniref:hypothetical protein n=1 Tax=Vibrio sp. WXL103 TaxID=3450710 RepID=UPI003EC72C92
MECEINQSKSQRAAVPFRPITQSPQGNSIAALLKQLFQLTKLSGEKFCLLSEEQSHSPHVLPDTLKGWRYRKAIPSTTGCVAMEAMFHLLCDSPKLADEWTQRFNDLAVRPTKVKDCQHEQQPDGVDGIRQPSKGYMNNKSLLLYVLLIICALYFTTTKHFISATSTNKQGPTADLEVEKEISETSLTPQTPQTNPVRLLEEEKNSMENGWLMDVYLIGKNNKVMPKTPLGTHIASYTLKRGSWFSFGDHYIDQEVIRAVQDKDVGLHYRGILFSDYEAEALFSIDYLSGTHLLNQILKNCHITLSLNAELVQSFTVPIGLKQQASRQSTVSMKPGKNELDLWFACNNLRSFQNHQDYQAYKDTKVLLSVKYPDSPVIKALTDDEIFLHR